MRRVVFDIVENVENWGVGCTFGCCGIASSLSQSGGKVLFFLSYERICT